jgi:hypothetical protein
MKTFSAGGGVWYRLISLKQYYSPTFITCSQIVSGMIELDGRNDIRCKTQPG